MWTIIVISGPRFCFLCFCLFTRYCSFFIYLVCFGYEWVYVFVCGTMKASDLFYISPRKKKHTKNFPSIVCFRFLYCLRVLQWLSFGYYVYNTCMRLARNDDSIFKYIIVVHTYIRVLFLQFFFFGSFIRLLVRTSSEFEISKYFSLLVVIKISPSLSFLALFSANRFKITTKHSKKGKNGTTEKFHWYIARHGTADKQWEIRCCCCCWIFGYVCLRVFGSFAYQALSLSLSPFSNAILNRKEGRLGGESRPPPRFPSIFFFFFFWVQNRFCKNSSLCKLKIHMLTTQKRHLIGFIQF